LAGAYATASCSESSDNTELEATPGGKADGATPEVGLDQAPTNTSCVAPARPPSDSDVDLENAFPNLGFFKPLRMVQRPGSSSHWYVMEQPGRIWRFPNQKNTALSSRTLFLDIRSQVQDGPNEAGLLGMAFHPQFAQNGFVFLSYTTQIGSDLVSRITRMTSPDGGVTLDEESEEIVLSLTQPKINGQVLSNHNGGNIDFGPDGFLYIGFGDGGSANDPFGHGQNTNTRFGTLLRINVDDFPANAPAGQRFSIPLDNPFANGQGGLPEIYAYGLRNPWRFSFDQQNGALWLGDVGQNAVEEIDIIENGGNYGWDAKEGPNCFSENPCDDPQFIDPVFSYSQQPGNNRSVTGGFVYRGTDIPGLTGSYVYGDFVSGRMWALSPSTTSDGWTNKLLLNTGVNIGSFAQGHDGEVYVLDFGGTIQKIVKQPTEVVDTFPKKLSETGCFDADDPTQPAPGLIPYDVNMPLWSDNADKRRFLALPTGKKITIQSDGDFLFPTGTVLVKEFSLGGKRIETRLLIRHEDGGWAGYTYEWNSTETDATLLKAGKTVTVSGQQWDIPSRADCSTCHTAAAGRALGAEFLQINGMFTYPSTNRTANQMRTWSHIGLFSNSLVSDPEDLPHLPTMNEVASAEATAKAYLHSNCSNCHRPGGPGRSDADFRFLVPFGDMKVCDKTPEGSSMGIPGASLLSPGEPDKSIIVQRLLATDQNRMPPLGSSIVHGEGVDILSDWVNSVTDCE